MRQAFEPTALVEDDRVRINVRLDSRAALMLRELLRLLEQLTPQSASLEIRTNRDTAEYGDLVFDVHAHDGHSVIAGPEHEGKVTRTILIRMLGVVRRTEAAQLE